MSVKRTEETERPYTVVFLTDGRPTIGEDRAEEIVKVASGAGANVRVFTWGVGHDVNTHLLDLIAEKTRAMGEYVAPDESIEQKVSLFFNKMSKPVLANPTINWGKAKVRDVYPTELGDLFAGQQVTVFGRYDDTGDAAVSLEGTVMGKKVTQTFEGTFGKDAGNSFVEKLWAARHVGFLLDEIRLHGEKQELKDEVIRLSRTYGIQTPYTSYLVLETKEEYARHGLSYDGGGGRLPAVPQGAVNGAGTDTFRTLTDSLAMRRATEAASPAPTAEGPTDAKWFITDGGVTQDAAASASGREADADKEMTDVTGRDAVRVAKAIAGLKAGETVDVARGRRDGVSLVHRIDGRSFYYFGGFWVDGDFTEKLPTVHVKYLSDAYFELVEKLPELKDVFAQGERIIVVVKGAALVVDGQGKEKLDETELKSLLGK
jgi:Ca-activated chloride channel family protein